MHHLHFAAHLVVGMYLGVEHTFRDEGGKCVVDENCGSMDRHDARRLAIWTLAPVYAEMVGLGLDDDPEAVALSLKASHEGLALAVCCEYGLDLDEMGASTVRIVERTWPQIQRAADAWLKTGGRIPADTLLELEHELLSEAA